MSGDKGHSVSGDKRHGVSGYMGHAVCQGISGM